MTTVTLWTLLMAGAVGLTLGNFVYQYLFGRNWAQAVERSFFQVWALVIAGFLLMSQM